MVKTRVLPPCISDRQIGLKMWFPMAKSHNNNQNKFPIQRQPQKQGLESKRWRIREEERRTAPRVKQGSRGGSCVSRLQLQLQPHRAASSAGQECRRRRRRHGGSRGCGGRERERQRERELVEGPPNRSKRKNGLSRNWVGLPQGSKWWPESSKLAGDGGLGSMQSSSDLQKQSSGRCAAGTRMERMTRGCWGCRCMQLMAPDGGGVRRRSTQLVCVFWRRRETENTEEEKKKRSEDKRMGLGFL